MSVVVTVNKGPQYCLLSPLFLTMYLSLTQVKARQVEDMNLENEILEPHMNRVGPLKPQYNHKYRHNKMIHAQISRLAHSQEQLDEFQQSLQTQILDVQRRMDRFEEPNWNLLSAKVEFLELEHKVMTDQMKNTTQKLSDFDKVHASILELREDLESVENKADKTIPEFRKEISKLDVNFAQVRLLLLVILANYIEQKSILLRYFVNTDIVQVN